jgi:DNA-directed RNA polymerase sigma subunit (sigma70/sigma32)
MEAMDSHERDKRICARRDAGLSFVEIGREFKISRERVRQIVSRRNRSQRRYMQLAPLREAFAKGVIIKKSD